jgi:hypothetical protein
MRRTSVEDFHQSSDVKHVVNGMDLINLDGIMRIDVKLSKISNMRVYISYRSDPEVEVRE